MFCQECGQEVPSDQKFCTNCGKPMGPPARAPQPPPAGAAIPVPAAPVTPAAPFVPTPAKPKKPLVPILIGVGAVLVIVAVVLVLVLVVFKGGGPETVVGRFLKAAETKNLSEAMKTIDPGAFKDNSSLEKTFKGKVFEGIPSGGMKFSGLQYETKTNGDKGSVKVVKGTATYTEGGSKKSVDITKSEGTDTFTIVRKDGKWYIALPTFGNIVAADYYEKAKDITVGSMQEASDKLLGAITEFGDYFQQQPPPGGQQAKEKLQALYPMVDEYKKEVEKVEPLYKNIQELEGSNLEDYKEYADLATELLAVRVELFEKGLELFKYAVDLKIAADSGQPVDTNATKVADDKTKEINQLSDKEKEIMDKMTDVIEKIEE